MITSRRFPDTYPNNYNCAFVLSVDQGQILLTVEKFGLEYSASCSNDYLLIRYVVLANSYLADSKVRLTV